MKKNRKIQEFERKKKPQLKIHTVTHSSHGQNKAKTEHHLRYVQN